MKETRPRLYSIYRGRVTAKKEGVYLLKVFATMWNQPQKVIECKEVIIKEGARVQIDGEEVQMLAVIVANEILHPVVSVEVM